MTLEKIKESAWFKKRPKVIQDAIELLPPIVFYKFKDSGMQCFLLSFEEPANGLLEDVTVTVQKTGKGSKMGLYPLHTNSVFGVKLNDLEVW